MDRFCHYYKVGPLLVVNEVINFISRVFTPGKPIYRAIYRDSRDCNSTYNDRRGAHLVGCLGKNLSKWLQ